MTAILGGTVNLTCSVKGDVYGWHKKNDIGDTWFLLEDKSKYGGSIRTHLTIKNVNTDDAGVYRCFAFAKTTAPPMYGSNITVTLPGT